MHHSEIPLPQTWPHLVRKAMLHISSLTHHSMIYTRSMAANSPIARIRLTAKVDRLEQSLALSAEIMAIKDARMAKIIPQKRPHYVPSERLRILELRAMHGWNADETANHFLVTAETVSSWMQSLDEFGRSHLLQLNAPVNKFPDFVTHVVHRIKVICPRLGKRGIAMILVRLGLHLSATRVCMQAINPAQKNCSREPLAVCHSKILAGPRQSVMINGAALLALLQHEIII